MKKSILVLVCFLAVLEIVSAKPVTITKRGGRVYSSVTDNPSNCTKQYKFTCGTNASADCFTLTYDDGTEALNEDENPKYLQEGQQEQPTVIQISDENGQIEVEGYLQNYQAHNEVSLQGNLHRVYHFTISINQ